MIIIGDCYNKVRCTETGTEQGDFSCILFCLDCNHLMMFWGHRTRQNKYQRDATKLCTFLTSNLPSAVFENSLVN